MLVVWITTAFGSAILSTLSLSSFVRCNLKIESKVTIPTDDDYLNGMMKRYFAKKVNEPKGYMEIDIDTFMDIEKRK